MRPYDALPLLAPRTGLETRSVLKLCIEARSALAALKQLSLTIPNPRVLVNTIPLLEAQASSEIENVVTTSDKLFRLAQTGEREADPATLEALRYRAALLRGYAAIQSRPLATATAVEVCSTIKNAQLDIRRVPGTALANGHTGEVIYTPPVGESLLREKLADWERFLHEREDLDPLVRMAAGHYQFEAIHPFADGNGRTGRVLNLLYLVSEGLLDQPVLFLSGHINLTRADYYRLLLAVTTDGAWEEWLLYMLEAVCKSALWTFTKIRATRALLDHTAQFVQRHAEGVYSRELVELLFVQPYCRIGNLVDAGIAKRQTASVYLKQLVDIGVLEEQKAGREKLFLHPKFMRLLTRDASEFEPYPSRG